MAGLDEQRCRSCHYYSNEIGCCDYIGITGHTRGEIVCLPNGRRYIRYPEICQHYRRKAGTVAAPGTMNFEAAAAKTVKEKPRRRALKEFPERLELYRQGLTDAEIGEKLGVSAKTIANWRLSRELPAHSSQARQFEHNETKRLELYDQGLTDSELAAACGCHIETIRAWRRRHRLENNGPGRGNRSRDKRRAPMYMPVREALYAAGLSDAEIAEWLQVAKSTITNWRHRRGYPPNTARKGESNEGENQQDGLLQARGEPAS